MSTRKDLALTHPPIQLLIENDEFRAPVGTGFANRMSRQSGFEDLSAGFMEFNDGDETPAWTAPYEEVMYVISGELILRSPGGHEVKAKQGEVVTVLKGAELTYQGTAGTKLFFALTPANWQENMATADKGEQA